MILSKIIIHGFKSFARKEELQFRGGLTVVVGPNGCGKTNVVDAIRWGLGEQRASILRADRMDSLIFGGAQSAKPLGMAEVSLVFDNSRHMLPIDYNEVMVTRRLYRSGESEYLLNKNPVRLKDISDLFMDTGIGSDAYSVIELKMVEDILSEKAEDRRKLIEEAAGVTKYKHRLKAAIRKLDSTQNDLLRVNDIITEVERTVRSLQRQVTRARRYKEMQQELKDLDLDRSSHLFAELQAKIRPLADQMKELSTVKDGRTTVISKDETELETLRLELTAKENALMEVQKTLSETVERIHRREGDIRVGKERISSLNDRIERYTHEITELRKRSDDQTLHLDVAARDRESLQVKITSTGRIFTNKKKELEVFQQGLNLKRLELNQHKKQIIECLEEINRLGSEETQLRARVDNSNGRLERLDEEDAQFHEVNQRVKENRSSLEKQLGDLQKKRQTLISGQERVQSETEFARNAVENNKEQFFRDQGELDSLQNRRAFLENLLENQEGVTSGSRQLIQDKAHGLQGVLAEILEVDAEYRSAIENGLGEAAGYLIFDHIDSAVQALEYLKHHNGGKATMISLDRIKSASLSRPGIPDSKDVVGWAADLITCDSKHQMIINHLLGDLLIVRNIQAARQLLADFKDHHFRIVTLDGEVISSWGFLKTRESAKSDTGMVGRRQRLEELDVQIEQIRRRMIQTEKTLKEEDARSEALKKEQIQLANSLLEIDKELGQVEKQRDKAQFETERAEGGLKRNTEERRHLLHEIEKGRGAMEGIRPRMETLLEERESVEQKSNYIQSEVDRLEKEEELLEDEVHKHNLAVVRLNGEAKNLDYDISRSQKLLEEIKITVDQRTQEIEEAGANIKRLKEEIGQYEKILLEELEEKEQIEDQRHEREIDYQKLREALQVKEKEIRQIRREREEESEKLHQLDMQVSDLKHRAATLKQRIKEQYNVNIETRPPEGEIDFDATGREADVLKEKLNNFGPVNLLALEEYDQEKERMDFMMQQRDDLLSAEETLEQTILKINQTARARFNDIFQKVRINFQEIYKRFFHGGEADLRLPEGEDPLEARIEIKARPTGKQMRDIDLLSGGEKTLTAISLLFALYMVKPSPFCVLDEIDAPLDDANVQRFTRVVNEFADKTQFVIVTHNKMTMKAASTLYGVTMQEQGVSKIVSVKFDDVDANTGRIKASAAG